MTTTPPAEIGMPLEEVDTPALLIDLDAFDRNIETLAAMTKKFGVRLRPHAKTHKSPVIALRQMAHGAVGQCCQKVGEAEVLVAGGVPDVLVTNQIVGRRKLERLAAISKQAQVGVCADNAENVAEINAAAAHFNTTIEVLVEIDLGMGRCGVQAGQPALDLAKIIAGSSNLNFGGLQCYHGSAQHVQGFSERRAVIAKAGETVAGTVALLKENGLDCRLVTGAGTGTFPFEASSGIWNEVQCGSYIFMDADYGRILMEDGEEISTFENSLFVWVTVMSRPSREVAVVDAGLKSFAVDSGMPRVWQVEDTVYERASDEHGKLILGTGAPELPLGSKIKLIPGHCDPTVNLFDWYVGIRAGKVEALWSVAARGAST